MMMMMIMVMKIMSGQLLDPMTLNLLSSNENNLTCIYPALLLNLQGDTQSMHSQLLDHKQTLE